MIFGIYTACVKEEDNISHLPLSLTGWGHPPWVFADKQIPAVDIARITHTQQVTQTRCPDCHSNNNNNYSKLLSEIISSAETALDR